MRRSLHKLIALPRARRCLLLEATVALAVVRLGVFLPLGWWPAPPKVRQPIRCTANDVIWAILVASRWIPRPTCLVRALSAQWLLARHGHPACLRIGVRPCAAAPFEAHAWLEHEGRVIIGDIGLADFKPMLAVPASASPEN